SGRGVLPRLGSDSQARLRPSEAGVAGARWETPARRRAPPSRSAGRPGGPRERGEGAHAREAGGGRRGGGRGRGAEEAGAGGPAGTKKELLQQLVVTARGEDEMIEGEVVDVEEAAAVARNLPAVRASEAMIARAEVTPAEVAAQLDKIRQVMDAVMK